MRKLTLALVLVLFAGNAMAAFTLSSGYNASKLYTAEGTKIWGLDMDGSNLYFGQETNINSLNLANNSVSTVGHVAEHKGIAYVKRNNGVTYTAYTETHNLPLPTNVGYIDGTGNFVNQFVYNGVYDLAFNSQGQGIMIADTPATVLGYDCLNGTTDNLATYDSYPFNVMFDGQDNLYMAFAPIYGSTTPMSIMKFSAAQVAAGELDYANAQAVLNIWAGAFTVDDAGNIYATSYSFEEGTYKLSKYDAVTGAESLIAIGDVTNVLLSGDVMYVVESPYGGADSAIYAVTVPEPVTMLLLGLGGIALRRYKR